LSRIIKINKGEKIMISECCSSPPLLNTDVHDGIAICDSCREWSGFYDEEEKEKEDNENNKK
jgi:hypothetical protein